MYMKGAKNSLTLAVLLLALMIGFSAYSLPKEAEKAIAAPVNPLPVVGSKEKLLELLKDSGEYYPQIEYLRNEAVGGSPIMKSAAPAAAPMADSAANSSKSREYSQTNTQVEGVDEADIIKTDGSYIYQVNRSRILVIKAQPPNKMQVVSKLEFSGTDLNPQEIYVDQTRLVVVGLTSLTIPGPCVPQRSNIQKCPPIYNYRQSTRVMVYDIKDKTKPKKIRELELEGNYLSSRKIGTTVYLVTNEHIYYANDDNIPLPYYRDSALNTKAVSLNYNQLRYFPDHIYPAYISVATINTANCDQKAQVESYLGNGENIYASTDNLYIAASGPQKIYPRINNKIAAGPPQQNTTLYKFNLNPGGMNYNGKGEVPGAILNQFSMDEYQGNFRIATTTGEVWRNDQYTSKNNVYILNRDMKLVGRLENIAPGEKIYSTRFMGDRAYMVTFKKVDPFFVIDMKNPQKPAILGKLKIPGYSDYLHPYDENHIIGFGKDTIETKGNGQDSMAFYQGLKVALFDVTDVNHPKEMSKVIIGDRGSDSELLNNHKALLFSKEKNLLAFPATVMKIRENDKQNYAGGFPAYGSFEFQGAYIYRIDLKNGLQFRGRISHLDKDDMLKAGDSWYDSDKNVQRLLYIGNNLYTLSQGQIQVNNLNDLKPLGKLEIE